MHTHRLNFLNPSIRFGTNVTVRLGDKWHTRAEVGDRLLIYKTGDPDGQAPIAEGYVEDIRLCSFKDVTLYDLENLSSMTDKTPQGLAYAMLTAYPYEFTLDSDVTVIEFIVEEPDIKGGEA